jgi:hypothetical protein
MMRLQLRNTGCRTRYKDADQPVGTFPKPKIFEISKTNLFTAGSMEPKNRNTQGHFLFLVIWEQSTVLPYKYSSENSFRRLFVVSLKVKFSMIWQKDFAVFKIKEARDIQYFSWNTRRHLIVRYRGPFIFVWKNQWCGATSCWYGSGKAQWCSSDSDSFPMAYKVLNSYFIIFYADPAVAPAREIMQLLGALVPC